MNWPSGDKWKNLTGGFATALLLGVGLAWAWVPKLREASAQKQTGDELEFYTSMASFSEGENARATLDAEVARFLTNMRQSYVRIRSGRALTSTNGAGEYKQWLVSLRNKAEEFKGMGPEGKILQEMFMVARMGKLKSEWLDEYLRLLYENPTQPLIASLTKEALETARELNRERDLVQAFTHLLEVPIDLENKRAVESVLAEEGVKLPGGKIHRHAGIREHSPALARDCVLL